ncbi:MAG: hypothetical protein K8T20_00015 [Planctomycetes bacterium]|nr:hypothetical protein [Planctomycetota bacterium]
MTSKAWMAMAIVVALWTCGCDSKPAAPAGGGGKSAPSRELDTVSHMGNNPAPLVDPTGSVQVWKGAKHQVGCESNLGQIKLCLEMYTTKTGAYPPPGAFFRTLVESGDIPDINLCAVPRSNVTREEVIAAIGEKVYKCTKDKLTDSTPTGKPIVWDPVPYEDGRHYLTFGGSVAFATEDQFQAMMTKWEGK